MHMRIVMLAAAILATACSESAIPSPSAAPSTTRSATPTASPLTFRVGAPQARMVATVVAFLDASNAGRVEAALALLTEDVSISDCGYGPLRLLTATGSAA